MCSLKPGVVLNTEGVFESNPCPVVHRIKWIYRVRRHDSRTNRGIPQNDSGKRAERTFINILAGSSGP